MATESFKLTINTAGKPVYSISTDGAAWTDFTASAAPSHTDGAGYWLGVSFDKTNGSVSAVDFYTASGDGTTWPAAADWTQLGSTQTAGSVLTPYDSSDTIQIGGVNTAPVGRKIGKWRMLDGFVTDVTSTVVEDDSGNDYEFDAYLVRGGDSDMTWTASGAASITRGYTVIA